MPEVIVALCSVVIVKLAAIIAGYGIIKMGYDALMKGVKGEFDFGGKTKSDIEFKLVSTSPGLFFVLFGAFIIIWALFVKQPMHFSYDTDTPTANEKIAPVQPSPESESNEKN